MEKTMPHLKKRFISNAFKYMIAVTSIAGTLGIWNLLANKDLVNANSQNDTEEKSTPNIDQAPLPTLVSVIKVDLSSLKTNNAVATNVQPTTENALREVARPTTAPIISPSSVQSLNNPSTNTNVDQGAPAVEQPPPAVLPPDPVTTTQSSKP